MSNLSVFESELSFVPAGAGASELAAVVESVVRRPYIQAVRNMKLDWRGVRLMGRDVHRGQCIPDDVRRRQLLPLVPKASPAGGELSQKSRDDFIAELDLARCPSIDLSYQVFCNVNADRTSNVQPSELFDHMHVSAIPYCDCVALDGEMYDRVKQIRLGKVYQHKLARDFGEVLRILEASGTPGDTTAE